MRISHQQTRDQKLIDLVPIVNVVLLLVFFFLLSWSFVLQPGVEVRLPSASFSSANHQGRHVVTLKASDKEALLFFDEKSVDAVTLKTYLQEVANNPQTHGDWITINADESVTHGQVQQVAADVMNLGFHVTIATQQSQSQDLKN